MDSRVGTTLADRPFVTTAPRPELIASPGPDPSLTSLAARVVRSRAFLFLAAAVVLYRVAPVEKEGASDDVVHITHGELQNRELMTKRALGVSQLTSAQLDGIKQQAIEDALLEHEARRMGLENGDLIVRRRLVQKSLFLAEDLGGAFREPTDAELAAYHAAHAKDFSVAAHVRFVHVFVADEKRLDATRLALAHLPLDTEEPPALGDPFPFPRLVDSSTSEVRALYGPELGEVTTTAPMGVYGDPVRSRYGWHFVRVLGRDDPRPSRLEEVKSKVAFAMLQERRENAVDDFVRRAFAKSHVEMEGRRVETLPKLHRLAMRDEGSAEDGP